MSPPQRGRGRGRWAPFNYQRTSTGGRRPKPISIQIADSNNDDHQSGTAGSSESQPITVRHIGANNEQYPGWSLYFPEESTFRHEDPNPNKISFHFHQLFRRNRIFLENLKLSSSTSFRIRHNTIFRRREKDFGIHCRYRMSLAMQH